MVMVATCDKANNKSSHSSGGDRDDQRLEAEENHAGLNRRTVRSEKENTQWNANIDTDVPILKYRHKHEEI